MFRHYIQVAIRSLLRKKAYTATTVFGLSVGLASCLLILVFVTDELSYDQYHSRKDRIYRLATHVGGSTFEGIAKVNGPWGPAALQEIPELQSMTRFVMAGQMLMENQKLRFYEPNGFYADSTALKIFSFELIGGDPETALTEPNSIVLTPTLANKYFPEENAVGRTLRLDGDTEVKVTGILKDVPQNSHFTFSYLLSMSGLRHPEMNSWTQWNQFYTYFLLRENARPESVAAKMKSILEKNMEPQTASTFTPFLQPLTDIHLHSALHREITANSSMTYVYVFSSIALLILAISCANFVNLTTAQASVRAKEVGVRKVNGAAKTQLVTQFLFEVSLICILSWSIAQGLATFALPVLNDLTGKNLQPDILVRPNIILCMTGVVTLTAVLAGIYPALYQSSLKPAKILKGKWSPSGGMALRKSLVIFQFALSSTLVIASVIIVRQLQFIDSKPLGFDSHQVVTIPIQADIFRTSYEAVRTELMKYPGVISISLSGNLPGGSDWGIPTLPEGFTRDNTPPIRVMAADDQFLKVYGMELASGRNFSDEIASDTAAYLINEECAKQLGWTEPLSKTMSMPAAGRPVAPVIGVVKDFHFRSLHEKIGPLVFIKPPRSWFSICSIRIDVHQTEETLSHIERLWSKFDPAHPFSFTFFDEGYQQLYRQEQRLSQVVIYFTAIGIFLACLGLYSLASFTTELRRKEIGIRKVVGASSGQIVAMLSRQFFILVIAGFALAVPVAIYFLNQWLQTFAYHIDFNVLLIAFCGGLSTAVALLTVSYRALKAASANPVNSLRSE